MIEQGLPGSHHQRAPRRGGGRRVDAGPTPPGGGAPGRCRVDAGPTPPGAADVNL